MAAAAPPKETVVALARVVPEIVTVCPPADDPDAGLTVDIVGDAMTETRTSFGVRINVPVSALVPGASVAPLLTTSGPASLPVPASVPALTVVMPEKVFVPVNASVPDPLLVSAPLPLMTPENVVEVASPMVRV